MRRWIAMAMVLLGGASYGFVSPIVKSAYKAGFSVQDVTSSQVYAACILLWLWVLVARRRASFTIKQIGLLAGLGVVASLTSVVYYVSLTSLPASLGIVMMFQFTWIAMLIEYIMTRRRFSASRWAALAVVLFGTLLAVNAWQANWRSVSHIGLAFGFMSGILYALFLYFSERVDVTAASPAWRSALLLTASVVTISIVFPPAFLWNGALGMGLWKWGVMIAFFAQIVPPICFMAGIPVTGGGLAALLGSVELPMAIIAARFFLHESVTMWQWCGVVLIVIGIALSQRDAS